METLFAFIDHLGIHPRMLFAVMVGLPTAWFGTQFIKRWLFLHGWAARTLAFALGFFPTWFIAPGYWPDAFWVAFLVGVGAPAAYKILVAFASSRWEWVRELSQDCRLYPEHEDVDDRAE